VACAAVGHNGPIIASAKRVAAAAACSVLLTAPAFAAPGAVVDGISDQSLPAWDRSFASSPLAALVRERLTDGAAAQIRFARYVVQWDAMAEPSAGPNPHGDYRERFEAWLIDARQLGLATVVALTSYGAEQPSSTGAYTAMLGALLARALTVGQPVAFVEPWNEPNGQGRAAPAAAARRADAANALCTALAVCRVIAGDFQDTPGASSYELAYEAALTFAPDAWGVHPYVSVAEHDAAPLASIEANLPGRGRGRQVWVTEVGGYYCRRGQTLGQARQAADAQYLLDELPRAVPIAPAHVFYYGLLYADGGRAPCTRAGGEDTELFGPGDQPRAAARLIFPQAAAEGGPLFGPSPGSDPLGLVGAGEG